jgi:uncharacterized protein
MKRPFALALAGLMATATPIAADNFDAAMAALRAGDLGTGAAIFNDLALSGDGDAMYNLALLYDQGLGLPQNRELALYWAWRARLLAVPKAMGLIAKVSSSLSKPQIAALHDLLIREETAKAVAEAPESFLRLALIEQGLAAKPDLVQVYVWYSLAAAMGHRRAPELRDQIFAALKPKDAAGAEAKAMLAFGDWCHAHTVDTPAVCSVFAQAEGIIAPSG